MSIAQTLIPDVLELIAEKLEKGRGTTHPDALSFALVCKSWHAAGIKELYRDLEGTLAGAEKAISARPELAQHVRRLNVALYPRCEPDLSLVQTLPRLHVLQARCYVSPERNLLTLATNPSIPVLLTLRFIAIEGTVNLDVADLFAILERATCLRHLTFFANLALLESTVEAHSPPFQLDFLHFRISSLFPPTDETGVGVEAQSRVQTVLFDSFDFSSLRFFSTSV
ncbi:hypothetical protein JCM6882_009006 [Rhodosporidiobolus microsporus]